MVCCDEGSAEHQRLFNSSYLHPPTLTKYLLAQQATFLRALSLNPNPDSWGVYKTPKTSNRNNSIWSDIKILFLLDQFVTKNVLELYLGKDFYF